MLLYLINAEQVNEIIRTRKAIKKINKRTQEFTWFGQNRPASKVRDSSFFTMMEKTERIMQGVLKY